MENKEKYIAEIALRQFAKYGFGKTTMQDVAQAARISRQTLYNHVANKNDLLTLVAKHYFAEIFQRCEDALEDASTLSKALDCFITHFIIEPWHTIKAIPEAEEFEATSNDIIGDEISRANIKKATMIEKAIITYSGTDADINPAQLASFFCATATGIKTAAQDENTLQDLSFTLKQSLMILADSHPIAA